MISALGTAVIPALVLPWALLSLRQPALFVLLPVLPAAVVYVRAIAAQNGARAVLVALAWALAWSVSTIAAASNSPDDAMRGIGYASAYRDEMVRWIATGVGSEGSLRLFLPRVLLEFALVVVLSALTGGAAGLLLGAILLAFMNGYVGWVVANADPRTTPVGAALLAWPPWAVARVVSFILAATAAALWAYPRIYARGASRAPARTARLFALAVALLLVDIGLKGWLAPLWREWLRALLGTSVGIEAGGSA